MITVFFFRAVFQQVGVRAKVVGGVKGPLPNYVSILRHIFLRGS